MPYCMVIKIIHWFLNVFFFNIPSTLSKYSIIDAVKMHGTYRCTKHVINVVMRIHNSSNGFVGLNFSKCFVNGLGAVQTLSGVYDYQSIGCFYHYAVGKSVTNGDPYSCSNLKDEIILLLLNFSALGERLHGIRLFLNLRFGTMVTCVYDKLAWFNAWLFEKRKGRN